MKRTTRWLLGLCLLLAPLNDACVQLIAFEQPIVGTPDVMESELAGRVLCDDQVTLGLSAACAVSCTLEPDGASGCDERITVEDGYARIDVSGMHEVEVTMSACGTLTGERRLGVPGGAGLRFDGGQARVESADGESLHHERSFFSSEIEECEERTVLFQDGRLELVESGERLCNEELPRMAGVWLVDLPRDGMESVEVCLRRPPVDQGN